MAVTSGKSPLIFTAVGDTWPPAGGAERLGVHIAVIRVVNAGAVGNVTIRDRDAGQIIWQHLSMAVWDVDQTSLPARIISYDGIYIDELPAGATVYVYYE